MDTHRSEELIKEFYRELRAEGMSPQAASRHRDKLRFFLHAFVAQEWPRDIDRVDGEIIRDFLGTWFIHNVGGAKSDVMAYLRVFTRFYGFLYDTGRLSQAERDELTPTLDAGDYFEARYDEYFSPLSWERTGSLTAAHDHLPGVNDSYGGVIDRQLWILIHNLVETQPPAALDFCLFLDYAANQPLKLTQTTGQLPSRHVKKINKIFSTPEKLAANPAMADSKRIAWFYNMAMALKLIGLGEKKEITPLPLADAFLDLDPDAQLAVIIDATWNRVSWAELGPSDLARVSEWAQMHRDGFAGLLAELSPEHDWRIDPEAAFDGEDALLAKYIYFHEVVENQVLYALSQTGVISPCYWPPERPGSLEVKSIATSRFGRQVMRLFLKRAERAARPEEHPLIRLRESLLPY